MNKLLCIIGLCGTSLLTSFGASAVTLIATNATWKYLDNGTDQGTAWATNNFNDTSWASGPAELGYGDSAEGRPEATVVSFGPSAGSKYITTYFRNTFNVPTPGVYTVLNLRVVRDDGVIVYLNGVEVYRNNMPTGPVTFNTGAFTSIGGVDEYTFHETTVNAGLLRTGNNLVTAEIHQFDGTSSDISFILELLGRTDAVVNNPPSATISSPANNAAFFAPADITITASASDTDGTVSKVEFFQGVTKLGEDLSSPYSFQWSGVPVGNYALRAVATDNLDARGTSAVVIVTVSVSSPPTVASVLPAPGSANSLNTITVNFSEPVNGVDAADLLIAGVPAASVTGSGSNYVFSFSQPADGTIPITWNGSHGIRDYETPPRAFDSTGPGATWQYTLVDTVAPTVARRTPAAGATVHVLSEIEVTFSEAVDGVDAADLRINGTPALSVSGSGSGPYLFGFASITNGAVTIAWAAGHGIRDRASTPNAFAGGPWSYTVDPTANFKAVVINEIMYHPSSELVTQEYIELFNTGTNPVNLTGWRFSQGVDFTFPSVTLPGTSYVAVAANVAAFNSKYPGIANVVGGWVGRLSNSRETIELEDASGDRVDDVAYADAGDFAIRRRWPLDTRGWEWFAEHDGLGKSLELVNPALPNSAGQNWLPSVTVDGTPGRANSVAAANIAPLILDVTHFPPVPTSSNPVTISARIVDELTTGLSVSLKYRDASASAPPAFSTAAMFDDGMHADGGGNDGTYAVTIPAFNNGTIVEFYVEATDSGSRTRTWPAAAQQTGGGFAQTANALYQVDDGVYSGKQPVYRIILTEGERSQFASLARDSDAEMNATFVTLEGSAVSIRYNASIRYRGASSRGRNPATYRVNIPSDRPWHDITSFNLNSQYTHAQLLGAAISQKAGLPTSIARAVQFRLNAANPAGSGSPQFGSYVHVEDLNGEWAEHHLPNDGAGNVYKAAGHQAFLDYRGTDPNTYIGLGYSKQSNASENDWTDLFDLTFALDSATTPDGVYVAAVRANVNVDLWLRYFAVLSLMEYTETSLGSGFGDDFSIYSGVVDPRFMVLAHDFDTILGEGDTGGNPNESIFIATAVPVMSRFLTHAEFEPLYYAELRRLLSTTFSTNQMYPLIDQVLGDWVDAPTIARIKSFVAQRNAGVLAQLPAAPAAPIRATISGDPPSPTYLTTARLNVGGEGITHYRFKLNNDAYGAETPVATLILLSGLANGTYTVSVIGRNSGGVYQAQADATLSQTWTVNTSLTRVVINEVLARNDSAVSNNGTFPDVIELFNARSTNVNLSGMGLSDDPAAPHKFSFPVGTTIAGGGYLVIYADNDFASPGLHAGFSIDQSGESLYLSDTPARGGVLVDSIAFGPQLANRSIGRLLNGNWGLTTPTFGSLNVAAAVDVATGIKINEWLTDGVSPFLDDFIELYNPSTLPVNLGGLYLTDDPFGDPARYQITPLTFIESNGFRVFIADGQPENGADHVNFQLSSEFGGIGLLSSDRNVIDCVVYVQQQLGFSQGRSPNGGSLISSFDQPTPGAGNPRSNTPLPPQTVTLIPIAAEWKYDQNGADLGVNWRQRVYDDSAWPQGPALLGAESSPLPEPIRTPLVAPLDGGPITTYFRTRFYLDPNLNLSSLELNHLIDDGAIFYLNGTELGRFMMPTGAVTAATLSSSSLEASYQVLTPVSMAALLPGTNVLAVEVHQSAPTSSDVVFGLRLDAVIITNNPALSGVVINEVLANNESTNNADGIELYNPSNAAIDLANMSLTDRLDEPRRWIFSAGSIVPGTGFLRVYFDPNNPVSATNTGFGLKANGDAIYLFNRPAGGGELLDSVTFGLQIANFSIGRVPNGTENWTLTLPSLGAGNLPASLGNAARLKVNEWMANPAAGEDWFEVFNTNAQPVALGGLHLTDDLNNLIKHTIAPLSFIGSGLNGYQRFEADSDPIKGANHVNFKLAANGESIGIATAAGGLIDGITFSNQLVSVAQGLLPDGSSTVVSFPETATPGEANYLPIPNVVVNEALTHSDLPLEDAIELRNLTGAPVNVGGWYLSDQRSFLTKFRLPENTTIALNSFQVIYEKDFNPNPNDPGAFALNSAKGDQIYLSAANGGLLTGYRGVVEFGAAENGVSFGRYVTSTGKAEFVAMASRSFGVDNPEALADFRTGTGRTNSAPKVGPMVINQIMYHPPDNLPNDNIVDEFIQLLNITGSPANLFDVSNPTNRWRLRDAVDFDFPASITVPAGGSLIVVSFDPATNAAMVTAFRNKFGFAASIPVLGPFTGKLDNSSDNVELYKPDPPQTEPGPDFGFVPYILVERVKYSDTSPWPISPDGSGAALVRVNPNLFGNDPANWTAGTPAGTQDTDNDGMPDAWENQYGLNPNSAADANLDRDGDGLSNLGEYNAGTDPTDPQSTLAVRIVSRSPVTLEFRAAAGKTYSVLYRNSLSTGMWIKLSDVSSAPTPRTVQVPDPSAVSTRFYKIRCPSL